MERRAAKGFQDLIVWQKAHEFVLRMYKFSSRFPREEIFGLASQLRRAAVSIPANIAEGFRRTGKADKGRMLNIAQGSLEECRYYLILANDLKYGDTTKHGELLVEVSKLLESYRSAIIHSDF